MCAALSFCLHITVNRCVVEILSKVGFLADRTASLGLCKVFAIFESGTARRRDRPELEHEYWYTMRRSGLKPLELLRIMAVVKCVKTI